MLASIMMTITLINTMTVVIIAVSYRSEHYPTRIEHHNLHQRFETRHYTFRLRISPQHG